MPGPKFCSEISGWIPMLRRVASSIHHHTLPTALVYSCRFLLQPFVTCFSFFSSSFILLCVFLSLALCQSLMKKNTRRSQKMGWAPPAQIKHLCWEIFVELHEVWWVCWRTLAFFCFGWLTAHAHTALHNQRPTYINHRLNFQQPLRRLRSYSLSLVHITRIHWSKSEGR